MSTGGSRLDSVGAGPRVLDDTSRCPEQFEKGDGVAGGRHARAQPVIEFEAVERHAIPEMKGGESGAREADQFQIVSRCDDEAPGESAGRGERDGPLSNSDE